MKENTNIFERILQIAEIKGFKNVFELANYMGYSSAEKLYRLKRSPDAKPSYDIIEDFTNKFEFLNVRWFVTGNGEKAFFDEGTTHTPHSNWVVKEPEGAEFTTTPPTKSIGKNTIIKKLDPPTDPPTKILHPQIISSDKSGKENILYVSVKAAAGYLNGYGDRHYMETLPSFSLPGLTNYSYRSFEVDGDSMFPTLENKEMVIGQWVEGIEYIREDRVHIVVTKNDGIIVKRLLNRVDKYGYVIAKSDALDNRNLYPNIDIKPEDILEIWYAVWHGSFNFKSPTEMYKRMNNLESDLFEVMRLLKENNLMR